jgi:hypothetical protein
LRRLRQYEAGITDHLENHVTVKNISGVQDAINRLCNPKHGDYTMVRAITINAPSESYDLAIVNAGMSLMVSKVHELVDFEPTKVPSGQYELVCVFNVRRVDNPVLLH